MSTGYKSFKDLLAWRAAQDLCVEVYRLTQSFPEAEKWGLASQMRRSARGISANLAEGYGRAAPKDFCRFMDISLGSASELESDLDLCVRLGYVDNESARALEENLFKVRKLVLGLKASIAAKVREAREP